MTEGKPATPEQLEALHKIWEDNYKGPKDYVYVGHNKSSILKTFAMFTAKGRSILKAVSLYFIGYCIYLLLVYLQKG